MNFPADAFRTQPSAEIPPGGIFLVRGAGWWLSASARTSGAPRLGSLALQGPNAGRFLMDAGQATVVSLGEGYGWEAVIRNPEAAELLGGDKAAMMLGPAGPCVWGSRGPHLHLFGLDGVEYAGDLGNPGFDDELSFPRWEVWLTKNGKRQGDGPLFSAGAPPE